MVPSLNSDDVLKLVANDELQEFCRLLGLEASTDVQRNALANTLATCSRTKILSALISVNQIWIHMMRDILRCLGQHRVFHFAPLDVCSVLNLNDKDARCHLSPQLANLIASFDHSAYRTKSLADWDAAKSKWQKDLRHWIQRVIQDGRPVYRVRPIDSTPRCTSVSSKSTVEE